MVAHGHVYWGNIPAPGEDTIGRAKTNGTQVNHRFLRHTTALALAAKAGTSTAAISTTSGARAWTAAS